MSQNPESRPGGTSQQPKRRGILPPEVMDLMVAPVKVGAWSGGAGALAGVAGAIARDTNPFASGILSGAQWFTLGGTFWFARSVAVKSLGDEEQLSSPDKIKASAVGGSAAGALAGLIRGPTKILPAMALWGVLGATGQMVVNNINSREPKVKDENDSWMRSKWSPLRKITDEEYIDMMEEKILRVDVDIALIDDRIAELRAADEKTKHG
ncbi:hypothetical protein PT974_02929 [Cladobotryum mycophilum]|uniref:Uncharacterized protein n=1 Tax=Cladobotryum mycophilum TaxID=491253 RepID=A0ABR0T0N2_9HYPO